MSQRSNAKIANTIQDDATVDYYDDQRAVDRLLKRMLKHASQPQAPSRLPQSLQFATQLQLTPLPPFEWRKANWGLIFSLGGCLFAWWIALSFILPAIAGALNFLFGQNTA